ncbi:hypothetical protein HK103_004291 [Boothiomyces macroporosus]|uniref:Uncharacterized protein n=1 Tax=Boothiomyces macroporosus TaxID=261099 RepID=A0AAD5UGV4_9FUNG|nr:hypothetical protein HK103_004291 [Boothiomyces macroporosus]
MSLTNLIVFLCSTAMVTANPIETVKLFVRQSSPTLFNSTTAYDRLGEFMLFLTLAMDLATIVTTTTRKNRYMAMGLFVLVNMYYFLVMIIHCNDVSSDISAFLGVLASLFWWAGATTIAFYEFVQFIAIMKAVRPSQAYIAEGLRVVIMLGIFITGFLLLLDYSTAYNIQLPEIFSNLTLVNLIQCAVCIPRLLSTFWILYVLKDIARITDGVVRKLGKNYIRISGIQIVNGLVGLAMMFPALNQDSRFVSLVGSIVEILLHYSICHMLAAELANNSSEDGTTSYKDQKTTAMYNAYFSQSQGP